MQIREDFRQKWIATQKKYDYPVNAIGLKIDPSDAVVMQAWRDHEIDTDQRCPESQQAPDATSDATTDEKPAMIYRGAPVYRVDKSADVAPASQPPQEDKPVMMYRGARVY